MRDGTKATCDNQSECSPRSDRGRIFAVSALSLDSGSIDSQAESPESLLGGCKEERKKRQDEAYWDESSADHDLEVALSQMVIPAPTPTSSQPHSQPQTISTAVEKIAKTGLPKVEQESKQWGGYVSRNKRQACATLPAAFKMINEPEHTVGKVTGVPSTRVLSNKRLVAPQQAATHRRADQRPNATKSHSTAVSKNSPSPLKADATSAAQPSRLFRQSSHTSSSTTGLQCKAENGDRAMARTNTLTKPTTSASGSKLHSAFKPPTVLCPELADKAKEKQRSVIGVVVHQAPAYEGSDLLEVDFDDVGDMSF